MSIFDDLISKSKQAAESVGSNVWDHIQDTIFDPFIGQGEEEGGNQTSAQIQAGQYGYNSMSQLKPSAQPASATAPAQAGFHIMQGLQSSQALLIVGGLLIVFLLVKRK